jgi:hypothetical protein
MKQPLFPAVALLLPLAAACGSVDAGAGPGEDGADPGDHTDDADAGPGDPGADADPDDPGTPAVLSVTPADGAGGVMPDAEIIVEFSRPMDEASVEAAWSSASLPAAEVSFAWNPAGDVLTVTPDDPLPVAEGSGENPDAVEPIEIAFRIADSATDADGNELAERLEVQFRTVRRLSLDVTYHAPLSDSRFSSGSADAGVEVLFAGDDNENQQIKMVVSFALPDLPADAVIDAAIFRSHHRGVFVDEAYQGLGDLRMSHVRFNSLATAFAAAALGTPSVLSDDPAEGDRSLPVTRAVADDYADDRTYSQFRAEFPTATDNDEEGEIAVFGRAEFELSLAYLTE